MSEYIHEKKIMVTRKIKDKTGFYESKYVLAKDNKCRCTMCKEIKDMTNFSIVNKNVSDKRRKKCNDCRRKQMNARYKVRKELKKRLDNNDIR